MSDRTRTADLMARLRRHYIKPGEQFAGGIFVPECGLNGSTGSRVDALYVGFTNSSGRMLVGHEVKVSRADWRRELEHPGKADTWADECHAWYVVAPDTTIVPPEEVPAAWGLMVINPRTTTKLRIVKPAPTFPERVPSWRVVRSIMARQDTLNVQARAEFERDALDKARRRAEDEARARLQAGSDRRLTGEERARLDLLDRLENAAGYKLAGFTFGDDEDTQVTPERLAAAIAICRAAGDLGNLPRFQRQQLAKALDDARVGVDVLAQALDEWAAISGERRR